MKLWPAEQIIGPPEPETTTWRSRIKRAAVRAKHRLLQLRLRFRQFKQRNRWVVELAAIFVFAVIFCFSVVNTSTVFGVLLAFFVLLFQISQPPQEQPEPPQPDALIARPAVCIATVVG